MRVERDDVEWLIMGFREKLLLEWDALKFLELELNMCGSDAVT